MPETCGRPRPHEREGPTSEAQWEGRAVEDCEGFQATYYLSAENRALPMIIDSFAGARNDRKGIRKEISPRASSGRNDRKG